jgi:hypothetical protein
MSLVRQRRSADAAVPERRSAQPTATVHARVVVVAKNADASPTTATTPAPKSPHLPTDHTHATYNTQDTHHLYFWKKLGSCSGALFPAALPPCSAAGAL